MALMAHDEFTRTALLYAVTDFQRVFGQKAAVSALECLTQLVREAMVEEQKTAIKLTLENARPLSSAVH